MMPYSISRRAFAFLELLIVAAIVGVVVYSMLKMYYKKPMVDKETAQALKEQNIDTATYKTTVTGVQDKLAAIQEQSDRQMEEVQKLLQ